MKHRLTHLDFLRGVAALLVCVEHIRAFLLVPYDHCKSPNLVTKLAYFFTGLGHQAVMVFFVLSGFLVGGSVISAHQSNRWSWDGYLLRRLTRLWVVLIPALLLTLFWDRIGETRFAPGYQGALHEQYHSGPRTDAPADLRLGTMACNTLFLQTIAVNCYGTNGPLWSLANEFWYYILFPLLVVALWTGGLRQRVVCGMLAGCLLYWLPGTILLGGLVWLLGVAVFLFTRSETGRDWSARPFLLWVGVSLASALLAASRVGKQRAVSDLLVGGGFAVLVCALAVRPVRDGIYTRASAAVSEFSYTLYLVHFPILAFIFFALLHGKQMLPGASSALGFVAVLFGVVLYAACVWWGFERNTDRVRLGLQAVLRRCLRKPNRPEAEIKDGEVDQRSA